MVADRRLPRVSIPRSEFCLFGLDNVLTGWRRQELFQFPARNSVCSDLLFKRRHEDLLFVSIPRSEFCLFGPG